MTSPMTGPAWYWIAATLALVLWAWALIIALAVILGRAAGLNWRHRGDRERPIPGADEAIALTRPPARQAPIPQPAAPGHKHGQRLLTARFFADGCTVVWDAAGKPMATFATGSSGDFDSWTKEMKR